MTLLAVGTAVLAGCQSAAPAGKAAQGVLLVCNGSTKPCPAGPHYRTVQAAVSAARPGDWVLIWPGVYHEDNPAHHAGVWITTPHLHLRGMDRNAVIIDGSHGTAGGPCPASPGAQDLTPRDGIVVWKASGVSIENLTVCDYLAGPGARHGTQIWWDGGDAGQIGLAGYSGAYLTTTSMYHPADISSQHLAEFGIFAGDAAGPGTITDSYASNMANAALYVGACGQACDATLARDAGTGSATGFLGTNAGGRLVVRDSAFDGNRTGIVLESLNTDDQPPPQDGRCPASTTASCTVIKGNRISGNDNAGAPAFGIHPAIGVGVEISGGRYDTVTGNIISGNGAWGVLVNDNVDGLSTLPQSHCQGGTPNVTAQGTCLFAALGSLVTGNTFSHDGSFGNLTNADLAMVGLAPVPAGPRVCFSANRDTEGPVTSSPPRIQAQAVDGPPCNLPGTGANPALLRQLGCADGLHCAIHARYPAPATISATPLPQLPAMSNPCLGVPENGFCQRSGDSRSSA